MKKSRGIISLILVAAVMIFLGFTCIFGLNSWGMGAAKNINLGLDLEGGVSITYRAVGETPSQEDMDDTVYKLQRRVEEYSTEAQAYQQGNDRISIEIPGVQDANAILEELGQPGSLYFIRQNDSSGNPNYSINADGTAYELTKTIDELEADGSIVLTGNEVESASAGTYCGFNDKCDKVRSQPEAERRGDRGVCRCNAGGICSRRVHRDLLRRRAGQRSECKQCDREWRGRDHWNGFL